MAAAPDFPAIIAGFLSSGETRTGLAEKIGVSRETLWRLQVGEIRQPSFSTGYKLMTYHERISRANAPRVTPLQRFSR